MSRELATFLLIGAYGALMFLWGNIDARLEIAQRMCRDITRRLDAR